MILLNRILLLFSILLCSCGGGTKREFQIGIDPTWTPSSFDDRTHNVTAFSTELLTEIGRMEKISITKINVSWDNLMPGLLKKKYSGILNALAPQLFNQTTFDFSDLYLLLGPVLVVRSDSPIDNLNKLEGKQVAVLAGSIAEGMLQQAPGVLIRDYALIPNALNDVVNETIDAAAIDILTATAYCRDIYHGQLKIATPPLNDAGLRLVTLHNASPDLIHRFNKGLQALKASGKYDQMLSKWGLQETTK